MKRTHYLFSAIVAAGLWAAARPAQAQTITFPAADQDVRGTIKVTFDGVPDGGYVMLYLDGTGIDHLKTATSETSYMLNTFALPEGKHTLTIVGFNAGGKHVGNSDVTFNVANSTVDTGVSAVPLRVWTIADRLSDTVRRYRVVAESNATIEGGTTGGGGDTGGTGGGDDEQQWIPAPLDWQVDLLIRSVVRDVDMTDGAANIRSIVQEGFQRQRISEQGGGAGGGPGGGPVKRKHGKKGKPGPPVKAPWGVWGNSADTGRYFVKTVKPDGDEINATKKIATLAVGDLLPTFPDAPVRPGSTWTSQMSLVGEIPISKGITVSAPTVFVSFEVVQTPAGAKVRCAKLESRFALPRDTAEKIGHAIQAQAGSGKGAGSTASVAQGQATSGVFGAGGATGGGEQEEPPDFVTISTNVSREIWFDIKGNQVIRSTDTVNTNYEEEKDTDDAAGGAAGGPAGGDTGGDSGDEGGEGGGNKVSYNLRITRYLDDRIPSPSRSYLNGEGPAHSRDSVKDIGIGKIIGK